MMPLTSMPVHLLIRADSSATIGTGHVMRCLALAHVIKTNGGKVCFVAAEMPTFLQEKIVHNGFDFKLLKGTAYGPDDAKETLAHVKAYGAQWIVLDGYAFDDAYEQACKESGVRILSIDDYGHAHHDAADLVLNQNIAAKAALYKKNPATLLLGTHFAVLRKEFAATRSVRDIPALARNVLITLGGSDPENMTARVIEAINGIDDINVKVVIGGANPHKNALAALCKHGKIDLIVDAQNMCELMRWADIAISGSGTTTYELACMGVPMLLMVLAENQRDVALQWESTGTAINLGWHTDITPGKIREAVQVLDQDAEKRSLMSKQGQSHVDGYGALRVCRELSGDPLWLREAVSDDCMLIFTWANEPEARAASFSSEAIAEKEHVQWFTKKLSLHHDRLYIGMDSNDLPVGLVRFAIEEKRATISVNLDKASRGKGYGTVMITQGCHRLFATSACENIDAFIKPENSASAKAFGKAGFVACPQEKIQDQYALRMSLSRSTMLL